MTEKAKAKEEKAKDKKDDKKEDKKEKTSPTPPAEDKVDCKKRSTFEHLEAAHKALGLSAAQLDAVSEVENGLF